MKHLVVLGSAQPQIKRMIMQSPGRPPMEMQMGMMLGMGQRGQDARTRRHQSRRRSSGLEAKLITVPAGTFACEHYRKQEPQRTVDMRISSRSASLRDGEDVQRGDHHGAGGRPQQPNFAHPRRAPEDGYAISAVLARRSGTGRSGARRRRVSRRRGKLAGVVILSSRRRRSPYVHDDAQRRDSSRSLS